MPLVSFHELMAQAEAGQYAVGYFESWNLESLLAVADAAEAEASPVILGISGIYLPHQDRAVADSLGPYAALGLQICRELRVPACLIFNESPHFDWVLEAIDLGFGLVMYTDEQLAQDLLVERVSRVVQKAHGSAVNVEGELAVLPGVGGELSSAPSDLRLTDPIKAQEFVERTGVDALAVNIGQAHLHGRGEVRLNLPSLKELRKSVQVPLVLHGASSVRPADIEGAISLGIRKINVGSVLKRAAFEAIRSASLAIDSDRYNPYEVIGSGLQGDVLVAGRLALQTKVEELMRLFGSAGRAW